MKAVIPCALKEDSLFPFIESKPTGLIPVAGKPIVRHLISDLEEVGVDEVYLVTSYKEEMFEEEFESDTKVNIVTQEELNGTGGAVEKCGFIDEDFLVVNGDVIVSSEDLQALVDKHENTEDPATILATDEDSPEKFGVLSITNDRVVELEEKPDTPENTLINTGIYVFTPEIFSTLEEIEDGRKDLTDAVQRLISREEARFELVEDYWVDIGSLKKLWKADKVKREFLINETEIDEDAEVHESVEITDKAVVERGAEIKAGTVIEGKTIIGENSRIGPNTTIKDSTIGANSQIRAADIESSVLFEQNIVDSFTSVENCVIAEESDIKSNTVIRESFIGPRSFVEMNNSIYGVKFVPDARTDLGEISK
jgi:NDP-sugar pyrophosphorylase family protein